MLRFHNDKRRFVEPRILRNTYFFFFPANDIQHTLRGFKVCKSAVVGAPLVRRWASADTTRSRTIGGAPNLT